MKTNSDPYPSESEAIYGLAFTALAFIVLTFCWFMAFTDSPWWTVGAFAMIGLWTLGVQTARHARRHS